MASVRPFHRYRGATSFTLPQLIALLKEQIPLIVPSQTRYRVTEFPTERTIRFYTARGLVDKPLARDGVTALYGYRHLLQVLAVKYLQSHYLPLVKVKSLVEKADNRELEQIIPEVASVSAIHRGMAREDRKIVERPPTAPGTAAADHPEAGRGETAMGVADDTWHRIEVSPGIELNIHASALSAENRERLRGALLRELGVLRGWFAEGDGH